MNATGPVAGPPFERSEDQRYFQAIERAFIELRGAPLQLSPDDYQVSKEWRTGGVPLQVVLHTLREVVGRQRKAEKEVKKRLRYYRRAVAAAWETQRGLQAAAVPMDTERLGLVQRLGRLSAALASFPWAEKYAEGIDALVPTEAAEGLGAVEVEAVEVEAGEVDAEGVEAQLTRLDRGLLDTAEEALDAEARQGLEERLSATLARLQGRLTEPELERNRQRLHQELVRRQWGLPVLSLFGPAAMAGEAETESCQSGVEGEIRDPSEGRATAHEPIIKKP